MIHLSIDIWSLVSCNDGLYVVPQEKRLFSPSFGIFSTFHGLEHALLLKVLHVEETNAEVMSFGDFQFKPSILLLILNK